MDISDGYFEEVIFNVYDHVILDGSFWKLR